MIYGTCRSCRRQVHFARSAATGNRIPLQPEPHDELGNILVDGHGRAHVFGDPAKAEAARDAEPDLEMSERYVSHYATSPDCRPASTPAPQPAKARRPKPSNEELQEALPF